MKVKADRLALEIVEAACTGPLVVNMLSESSATVHFVLPASHQSTPGSLLTLAGSRPMSEVFCAEKSENFKN